MSSAAPAPTAVPSVTGTSRLDVAFLPLHVALIGLVVVACFIAINLGWHEPQSSYGPFAATTGLAGIALMAYCHYILKFRWVSASIIYLFLIWVFHYGLTFTALLAPQVLDDIPGYDLEFTEFPNARVGMILGTLGSAGFVLAVGLWRSVSAMRREPVVVRSVDPGLFYGGWAVMLAGIVFSIAIVAMSVGLSIFSIGYMDFLGLASTTWLGTALGLSHLGCLMAICGAEGRRWIAPFALWTILIAAPMMLLGSRSGAMISLLGFAIVLYHRGVRFNRGLIAAAAVGALVVVPAVESFRMVGFANRSADWTDVTPLDSFVELGGSLRATAAYIDWIDEGDQLQMGATYWAPIDRQVLMRMMPWRERVEFEDDERLPQRKMVAREGSIGGSATGEAYYNFGLVGPFVFCFFIGLLFGWLEGPRVTSPTGAVTLGIVMFVMFFHVRGDWLPVPATILQGLLLLAVCHYFGRMLPFAPHATTSAAMAPTRS